MVEPVADTPMSLAADEAQTEYEASARLFVKLYGKPEDFDKALKALNDLVWQVAAYGFLKGVAHGEADYRTFVQGLTKGPE